MKKNYQDYTYMARFTKGYPVSYFQTKGAKVHFNFRDFTPKLENQDPDRNNSISCRYGIIGYAELLRDLRTWETLMASSIMMRPHQSLGDVPAEVAEATEKNLASALAFSAFTLLDKKHINQEEDIYENIVGIPHYE